MDIKVVIAVLIVGTLLLLANTPPSGRTRHGGRHSTSSSS